MNVKTSSNSMKKHAIPKGNAKRVAVLVTEYRYNSHADVILGRLLGDFDYRPQVEVVSLYTDQVPDNDMSRAEAARCGVPIYATIAEAVQAPCKQGGLNGIIIIGEHGDYPEDELGRKHYPRRRLLTEALEAMDECGLVIPVFSDKHLAFRMEDSLWMFGQLRSRGIPFMGGSSIPHIPPVPAFDPRLLKQARELLVVSYSDSIEAYGYHGLELMQSLAEQRNGGETGVRAISVLQGDEVWQAMDAGEWPEELLLSALACYPERRHRATAHPRTTGETPTLFKIEYCDGFAGYVLQQATIADQWGFAFRGEHGPVTAAVSATDTDRPWEHFGRLTAMIEQFIITGQEPFPAERILMSSGLINLSMEALHLKQRIDTPQLHTRY